MKKILTTIILSTLATTSAYSNIYVQVEAGHSSIEGKEKSTQQTIFKSSSTNPRISLGFEKEHANGNSRYALDYTHFGTLSSDEKISGVNVKSEFKIQSIGASGIAYLGSNKFQPYLGVRLSYNKFSGKASANGYGYSANAQESDSSFGYGALVGISYKVTPKIAFNIGAEYNQLSSDASQYGGRAGISYKF